jgi:hypothetical protein
MYPAFAKWIQSYRDLPLKVVLSLSLTFHSSSCRSISGTMSCDGSSSTHNHSCARVSSSGRKATPPLPPWYSSEGPSLFCPSYHSRPSLMRRS